MAHRFEKIRQYVPPAELQAWATNLLSGGVKGVVRKVPDFVWRGHSDSPPYTFVPYPGQVPSVWVMFGDASDSWSLLVGHTNFALPLTNNVNRNCCIEWVPGVYFSYER